MPDLGLVLLLVGWATVGRALLVYAQKLPPTCGRCGMPVERRHLGDPICPGH